MEIQIAKPFQAQVQANWLKHAAEETLSAEGLNPPVELSLVITDDKTVHKLNRTYRGVDRTTDVLAFALQENKPDSEFPLPPDGVLHLGEVIISFPQAMRQAKEHHHSLEEELKLLVVHGVLHLLGYDDEQPEKEKEMRAKEAQILAKISPRYRSG